MLIPRSSNLIRQISKGLTTPLKQMRPQIKNLSQLSEKVANLDVKTCTIDKNLYFSVDSSSLPVYKKGDGYLTPEGTTVNKVTTDGLVYCVSAFFILKSLEDTPSILAIQAIHISDQVYTNVINLTELESPLKETNTQFTRECITYRTCPGLDNLKVRQRHTLSAISELCDTHGYSKTEKYSSKDKVTLDLTTENFELYSSSGGIRLKLLEAAHFSSIFLIPLGIEKVSILLESVANNMT